MDLNEHGTGRIPFTASCQDFTTCCQDMATAISNYQGQIAYRDNTIGIEGAPVFSHCPWCGVRVWLQETQDYARGREQ